jgi:mannose-6-phosphate isomerase-like protein (cupin superfamily)
MGGDLPSDVDATLSAHVVCKKADCQLPGLVPETPAIDLRGPAAVWSHELAGAGHAVALPRHADVDIYGVVMKGSVQVSGVEGGKPLAAGRWTAFRAPGAGVTVAAREAGARVVLAAVSSGGPLADAVGALRAGKGSWKTRPAQLEGTDLTAAKDLAWGGGAMHARIAFEGDKQRASLGVLMGSRDAPVGQHQHDTSWEVLVALRAAGTARRANAPGAAAQLEPVAVKDGTVVTIPKATQHSWTPDGHRPLIAVQLYVPPGPEQRFKQLAAGK